MDDLIPIPNFHPPFDNDLSNFPEFDDVTAANLDDNPPFDVDFDFDLSVDDLFFADSLLLQPDPFNSGSDDVRVCDSGFDSGNCSSDLLINSTDYGSNIVNDAGIQLDLSSEIRVSDVSPEIVNSSSHSLIYRDDNGGIQLDICPKNSDQIWLNSGSNSNDNDGGINLDSSRKISDQDSNNNGGSGNNLDSSRKISDQNSNNDDDSGNNMDLSRKISDQNSRDNSSSGSVTKCGMKSKRKKGVEYDHAAETRSNKIRRSGVNADGISSNENVEGGGGDDEEKRKARMIRNRESAHLSRQRKKQYVEELEDKVKAMVSTISDLNGKISYFMTENANLRQQLCGGGVGAVNGMYPAYPMPGMAYPWMPYPPPGYMVNPHGSKVPLLPIPRVKSQQPAPAPKVKKSSKGKTKKVASVNLFGLLFFMLLFGGLVPLVNVKYGKVGDVSGVVQKGSVFKVDNHVGRIGHGGQANSSNGGNASEPLVASLYVPRNDKLMKIDGNLIIQSVLVSEKALASEETGLALHGSYPPYPTPGPGSNDWRHPYLDRNQNGRQRALGSGSTDFTPIESDGKLPQWFREGLAGPMLSSGMCTQVFQFDVSPTPRSIVPAPSLANTTSENRLNYTRPNRTRNRRILKGHDVPHYNRTLNTTKEQVQQHERSDGLQSNKTGSSVVVSVLVDPREIGDSDGESVIGSKTLSRIFVVVLVDSVKYVTYSCVLPFMGSSSHLITT